MLETWVTVPGFTMRSITRIATPPAISATATTWALPSSASICLWSASPMTTAGSTAMTMLRVKRMAAGLRWMRSWPTVRNVRQ